MTVQPFKGITVTLDCESRVSFVVPVDKIILQSQSYILLRSPMLFEFVA